MTGKPDDSKLDQDMIFLRALEEAAAGDLEPLPPPRQPRHARGIVWGSEPAGPPLSDQSPSAKATAIVETSRTYPAPATIPMQGGARFGRFCLGLTAVAASLAGIALWSIEDMLRVPEALPAQTAKASRTAERVSASAANSGNLGPLAVDTTPALQGAQGVQAQRLAVIQTEQARAVQTGEPAYASLKIAAMLTLDPGGTTPFPITVEPANFARGSAVLQVRGLTEGVSLSHGAADTSTGWRVPLADAPGLMMLATAQASGRREITVELRSRDDVLLATARSRLVISSRAADDAMSGPFLASEAVIREWLAESRRLIALGNVAAARLMLERAAAHGRGEAALMLGDTYDPAKLYALGVRGISGDVAMAILWYERADELGEGLAKGRLIGIAPP